MYQSFASQRLLKVYLVILIGLLASTLPGCREDDEMGQLLDDPSLNNGNNFPNSWYYWQNNSNHKFFWSPKENNSKDFYFALETYSFDTAHASFFMQTIKTPIPKGKQLILRSKIKAENLTGQGVSIAIRCEGPESMVAFASTEGKTKIEGSFDWKEFSVVLDKVPDETNQLHVFLLYLPATTGKVFFDDITLTYQK